MQAVTREGMWRRQRTGRVIDEDRDPWVMVLIPCGIIESLEGSLILASAYLWDGKKLQRRCLRKRLITA